MYPNLRSIYSGFSRVVQPFSGLNHLQSLNPITRISGPLQQRFLSFSYKHPEASNCGVGAVISKTPLTADAILSIVRCNAARGARDQRGGSDGNSILFRGCEPFLATLYPKFKQEILDLHYQIATVHMPQDPQTAKEATGILYYTFEHLGIPIVAFYEQPTHTSVLLPTDRQYHRQLTHFLIVQPQVLAPGQFSAQNKKSLDLMGIPDEGPLTNNHFWKLCQLAYLRILLNKEEKTKLDMVGVDQSVTLTSLVREEILHEYYPQMASIEYREGVVQTRASTRTNVTMMGNHGGIRQENGENTNVAQIIQRILSSQAIQDLLGFAPDLSLLPDTHITAIYYVFGILLGRSPYEAYAHIAPMVDAATYQPTPLSQLISMAKGTTHQGPFLAFSRYPTEQGLASLLHKDPHADRPGFGFKNQDSLHYGSSRQEELFVEGGQAVSIIPGAPILLQNGTASYLQDPELQDKAQHILKTIPVLKPDFAQPASEPLSEEELSAIRNANYLLTDKKESAAEIFEKGVIRSVSMGVLRAYTGNNPWFKVEFVRGTAPPANEPQKAHIDMSLILGRQEPELTRSVCDPEYWADTVRIPSPILTPVQYKLIQDRPSTRSVQAIMPPFCDADTMLVQIKGVAAAVIAAVKEGAGIVIIQDFDRGQFLSHIPLPHTLVFGHIQKRLLEEKLYGKASLILHTNWSTDATEWGPLFSFCCSAIYAEPIFHPEYDFPFTRNEKSRANWSKASQKTLIDFCGINGIKQFRSFIGNLSTVGSSLLSRDVIEFVGLDPNNATQGINSFERIAALQHYRFGLTKTPQWTNTEGKVSGSVRFSGRDPRYPKVVQAIRTKKFDEAIEEIRKHSDQPIDRMRLNLQYSPARIVYHIYGFGPAGMTAFNALWEDARATGKPTLIRIFCRSPLGLARQALFPTHSDRVLGISNRTATNLLEALKTDSVETIGNVTVKDEHIRSFEEFCHHSVDARGALRVKMPAHPQQYLFTPPDWIYLSYSAGATATHKTEGPYRPIPTDLLGKNVNFTMSIGGGNVGVDQALWSTVPGSQLKSSWAVGEVKRVRPRVAHLLLYRGGPGRMPADTHDLEEFEKQGGKLIAVFDKDLAQQAAGTDAGQVEKLAWWSQRWQANNVTQLRWDVKPGRTIVVLFDTDLDTIEESQFNKNLLKVTLKQRNSQDGVSEMSFAVPYVVPCLGYEPVVSKPVTTLVVGQRDPKQVGNIPQVVTLAQEHIQSHLKTVDPVLPPTRLPALERTKSHEILGVESSRITKEIVNALSPEALRTPFDSQESANRVYVAPGAGGTPVAQDNSKDVEAALHQYLGEKGIRPIPDQIVVHDVRLCKTWTLGRSDFAKGDNLLKVLDTIYYKKEQVDRGLSESCGQKGTCGTCFGFEIPKKDRFSDALNVSPQKDLTSLLCTVTLDDAASAEQEMGRVFVIGSYEDIKVKLNKVNLN